ncbi:uncharacterized protein LOC135937067 [Cloeon dipterum]|uniref:uncharacterized protein LOC135937067 n=1 Tax=Cloeon dipterum TaxID=197152 RepID=UPI003220952C
MPEGPAKLGYFVSKDQQRKNADNVCVLVVHYNFEKTKDESWIRKGDAQDVENLEKTFRVNRNCNFRSILSPEKEELLQLLSNQKELLKLFGCPDVPSVFVLYILSHGDTDGKIFTDHYQKEDQKDFICFTTTEIFESLKKLTAFEECLKFINFGPCRGELIDSIFFANHNYVEFENENSCRITYSPLTRNTVVFFSTVETTKAKRDQKGTTFAFLTCQVLNSLQKDESLINVLTTIQYESHKVAVKETTGQTPEVKMFSQDRGFVISKSPSNNLASKTLDEIAIKRDFYDWKSKSGENLRRRLAILFSVDAERNEQLNEIKRALSQNLDFETNERLLRGNPWESINEASWCDSNIGCIFLIFFGRLSEKKDMNEVCVQVDGQEIVVSEILREFIGPKNDQWIGKPKVLFLVNQETSSSDAIGKMQSNMKISATNHSGWLVLVLHNKDELQKLIELFKGQELKKEKSLQELLASLLISESKENKDFLNSTLQYSLNFPDWPSSFVELSFSSVINSQKYIEYDVSFDSLVKESATEKQIWLLSSVAGTGKTTILREMAFQLGKLDPDLQILRISLPRVSFGPLKRNVTEFDFLANATHISKEEISKQIENKQCVVILDGFDEIRRENQQKVLKVIEALEKKQISIWVGTRPHAAETIKKRISKAVIVKIVPLNYKQQIEFLKLETGKSREDCELFIDNFSSNGILENPLHLSLVAKYGAEGNLYQIYDQVVRRKVEDSLINKGFDKDNENTFPRLFDEALKRLQQIASCHITEVELNDDATRKELEKFNCYGIATFENNKVFFIHQTFAEFLAAQHFLLEIDVVSESESQTSVEDGASILYKQSSSSCIEFVDLFYSTNEEKIEEDRTSILTVMKLNPDRFLELIVDGGCINIFKMIYQNITFSNNREGNCISVANDKTLLARAFKSAEEIGTMILDTDLTNSDEELLIILPYLLKSVAKSNATVFFEKLKTKYPRLPEMIHSRRFVIDAGLIAARRNHGEILQLLLESGVDVDFEKRRGRNKITDFTEEEFGNALHCAINFQAIKCVEILLKHGAKLAIDEDGESWDPLMMAVRKNKLDLVKLLLDENISGMQRNKETFEINEVKTELNALQLAIEYGNKEIVKFLFEKSPRLKIVENGNEGSSLQISAKNGNFKVCRWLVDEAGENVNTLRPSGDPRDWSRNDNKCMDHFLILQKSDINMTDERVKTALHCAAEHGYVRRVKDLIHSGANIRAVDENGWNAFHFACKSNSSNKKDVIRWLHRTDSQLAKEKTGSNQTGLHIHVEFGNWPTDDEARFLVEEIGVDVKAKDNQGCTALRIAFYKRRDCVDYLMAKDINLGVKNKRGRTCLHFAAERGDLEALQTWIELGGDLDVVDKIGSTSLHDAALNGHLQFVDKLLACAAEEAKNQDIGNGSVGSTLKENLIVNRCDNEGRTALHLAAKKENVAMVEILLENNADLTLTDKQGKNAIHYAIRDERMLRFLNEKNGDLMKHPSNDGNTILHAVLHSFCDGHSDKIALWIIEQVDDSVLNAKNASGNTPLLLACKKEFWRAAELLLTRNVEVNVSDMWGKTAMHYAAQWGKLDLVKLLHEKGADLTLTDRNGMNALNHATDHLEVISFLHEKNNELLGQRFKDGNTTLHLAIRSSFGDTDIILWVLEHFENDLNVTNNEGETPLLLVCKESDWHLAKILLDKNVDIHVKDKKGRTALHYAVNLDGNHRIEDLFTFDLVQELCKRGADFALTDNDGMNAFHHAIRNFHMALFIHNVNGDLVKQRLNNGDTSLHLAIKLNAGDIIQHFLIELVEQGVIDLNAKNASNETPLILACKEKLWDYTFFEILLSKNVDVNIRDIQGKSARDYIDESFPTHLLRRFDELEEASPSK